MVSARDQVPSPPSTSGMPSPRSAFRGSHHLVGGRAGDEPLRRTGPTRRGGQRRPTARRARRGRRRMANRSRAVTVAWPAMPRSFDMSARVRRHRRSGPSRLCRSSGTGRRGWPDSGITTPPPGRPGGRPGGFPCSPPRGSCARSVAGIVTQFHRGPADRAPGAVEPGLPTRRPPRRSAAISTGLPSGWAGMPR